MLFALIGLDARVKAKTSVSAIYDGLHLRRIAQLERVHYFVELISLLVFFQKMTVSRIMCEVFSTGLLSSIVFNLGSRSAGATGERPSVQYFREFCCPTSGLSTRR